MNDKPQDTGREEKPAEPNALRDKLIRLLKGMVVLLVFLAVCWALFGDSAAILPLAGLGIVFLLLYALYVFADWELKLPNRRRSRSHPAKPAVYYVSEHTPTSYAYVRGKPAYEIEALQKAEAERNLVSYRAHWAYFVKNARFPILIMLAAFFIALAGVAQNWEILTIQGVRTLLILTILGCIFLIAYHFLDWMNDVYTVDNESVTDINQKPFTKKEVKSAIISKIQTVNFRKQGLFQFMFDYGTLTILAGEMELTFDYVPHPETVQREIMNRVEAFGARQRLSEEDRQQGFIDGIVSALRQNPDQSPPEIR